ncbi:hypothetical protein [Streptomyces sp. NPDC048157]|uniref:hypothetical protein n=1 Tax=Streptomyces sp. NPDC048157 TaxID=3365503 RepID=UPI003717B47C
MSKYTVLEAVDALAVELGIGKNGLAFTWDQLERINGILNAHAHELAERIRAEHDTKRPGYHMGLSCSEVRECYVRDLVCLIDPEPKPTPRDLVFNCQTIEGLDA